MARNIQAPKKSSVLEDATMVATLTQSGGGGSDAVTKMANLLAEKLEKDKANELEQRDIALAARKAGAEAMAQKREREVAFQSNCPHMKPWGGPSIGGQRDHQGNYRFICLFCSKMWINDELPAHLKIALDRVGGPDS